MAPVTRLAEREHAVMDQATLHGLTRWKGVIRICGHLEGYHNRLNFRARSHRSCVCGMSKGRVCGAGVDAGVGWEVSGGWRWREVVLWMDSMSLSTRSNSDLDLDGRSRPPRLNHPPFMTEFIRRTVLSALSVHQNPALHAYPSTASPTEARRLSSHLGTTLHRRP